MNPHLGDSAADSRITPNRADGLARPLRCLTAALALGALFPAVASARTWYVYADGSGDAPFVQAAVDSAQDGDVILVGPGSYPEPHVGIRSKSLELASLDGPEVTRIRQLSLFEPPGDGVHSITVRGFTIQGGDAPSGGVFAANVGAAILENCVVKGFAYHSEISHVRTVVVSRCTFADNVGTEAHNYGGGALLVMPRSGGPLVQITECLFLRNRSPHGKPGRGWGGGGALALAPSAGTGIEVTGCVFDGNEAPTAGAVFATGATTLNHNTFINNRSQDAAIVSEGLIDLSYNLFVGNGVARSISGLREECQCNAYADDLAACLGDFTGIDPNLCDPAHGDYHLPKGSPLEGPFTDGIHDACEGPIGAFGVGCVPLPVVETSWGWIKAKYGPAARRR